MASQQVGWTIEEYATADGERPIRAKRYQKEIKAMDA